MSSEKTNKRKLKIKDAFKALQEEEAAKIGQEQKDLTQAQKEDELQRKNKELLDRMAMLE